MPTPLHLLFDPSELPRIKTTLARPEFASFWRYAREADLADDERFLREEIKLDHPNADLARAANILQRSAFVHAIEPDPRQLAIARLALQRVLEFPRWDWILEAGRDTVGAMRNGTTSIAVVLSVDWLANDLTEAEHAAAVKFIADEAAPAAERAVFGMTHHDQVVGWGMDPAAQGFDQAYLDIDFSRWPAILDVNNLRIIATSGLAAAAAFLHGRHPRAAEWAAMADASMRLFVSRLPQDGSFPEGPDYWHFTFNYYMVSAELLRRHCGIDGRDAFDFPAMARYVQMVSVPTISAPDSCLNIGDAFKMSGAEPLAWIGRHFRDSTANQLVLQPGTIRDLPVSAWAAIWFDPTVPATRSADLPRDRVMFPGIVISRSGWGAEDAVLSLRSGEPENHEHADRNSLIFTAHGERLLHDPVKASYMRTQPKWQLRLTAAHTALLIDGRGHQYHNGEEGTNASQAHAKLVDYRTGRDWMLATSDAADAYTKAGLPVTRAQRTVIYFKPDVVIVFDEVDLTAALPVQTRWQADNHDGQAGVTSQSNGFTITRPNAWLQGRVVAGAACTINHDILPLPADEGVYPFAEVVSAAAQSHRLLTVCSATPTGDVHADWKITREPDGWLVTGTHRERAVTALIHSRPHGAPVVIL
ncbi:MAG: heparinase II/III family protein [Opitutaceae bacterium]|nr:heparinase II/III family protein [Cephaloticoccus sp.]MCP5530728.1 heparinase II/III family protein [Opitutaceae bacterium]